VPLRLLDPAARAAWMGLCGERALPAAVVEAVARHPEPMVRRAFARNPFVDPAQRGRLVDDPDDLVRAGLAGDPTLGDPLDALLPDPDLRVRHAAAANPAVSPPRLTALLADPESTQAAAGRHRGRPLPAAGTGATRRRMPPLSASVEGY
jgi:hypothetical protein